MWYIIFFIVLISLSYFLAVGEVWLESGHLPRWIVRLFKIKGDPTEEEETIEKRNEKIDNILKK